MDAWWLDPQGHIRRSSLANEQDVRDFVVRTGQVECVLTHGIVTNQEYAMSIMVRNRRACVCGAVM